MIRRIVGQIHLWVGLLLCVPLVLIGLTGSALVFEDELRAISAPTAAAAAAHPASEIVAAAVKAAPVGFVATNYAAPSGPGRLAAVRLSSPRVQSGSSDMVWVDVDPGTLVTYLRRSDDFLRQIFSLHSTLLMTSRGRQLAGWCGVAMLVMAVTGLVNWWPPRANWRAAFTMASGARGYRLWRELHGAAGIWGFAVLAVVSFTGVYLAFPETIRATINPVLRTRDLRAAVAAVKVTPVKDAVPLGINEAIGLAQTSVSDGRVALIFLPSGPDQPYRVMLHRTSAMLTTVLVDPWAGHVIENFDPNRLSAGEFLLAAQHGIHAGRGFGAMWKGLVFLAGLLPALFAATGIAMWLKRRRRAPTKITSPADQAYMARRAGE